ncbi:sodium channel modifier 1 isoform X1 [Acyrthosiphon pisum]|uniref:Sodium channel modifier 1 n=1 Tax=Acyrthosiphon pisum TaxID=7029 RepID=A0A8R2D2P3_ACYPI|nr:sodium channel modifier 1 isoform X1 [Acyrthosiphon pisum]|eukprot:XP_016658595.1 PREDICTED: sodium channel modifier 1 isoform X1 [Acyrthosiphon pisum]
MSFKRVCDGSGSDLLKSLESQRIRELLGIQIPDGEAKLLSNGKLTCMICIQRPIFDTINVLSIHRKGKKHLNELSKYLERKEELELIKIKQQQKKYIQSFGASKLYTSSTERKTKLELPEDDSDNFKESSIVSRYVSSMKKKPSLQDVINRARKIPYQRPVCNSHTPVSKNTSDIIQSIQTSSNKEIEIGWIINSDGSWSKDPQAEFDSDDDW